MASAERIKWFSELKYGMFLHYGLFTTTGRCEWVYRLDDFTVDEYAQMEKKFTPDRGIAQEWAQMAKEAGMKYMVFTTRHHDGYCLWDTQSHDYNSVKGTPGRDIVAEYVEACREAGLGVGLYYSVADWRYKCCWDGKYEESGKKMVRMVYDQVRELMTKYGKIDILWFDGGWRPEEMKAEELWLDLINMARELQPDIVINDRTGVKCDFGTPERTIKPEKDRAWESCLTIDPVSWSNVPYSPNRKTTANVVSDLVSILCGGGNLLLNTGPTAKGWLDAGEKQTILEVGSWYKKYAEAFRSISVSVLDDYGSPFSPCGCQARFIGSDDPRVHYMITKCWTGSEFWVAKVGTEVESITLLPDHTPVEFHTNGRGRLILTGLPEKTPDPYAAVFKITFKEKPEMYKFPDEMRGSL
ncbi:MAG: alpha-L-fucosidase [Clostridiales bacterium]|nr:alpha-L-fucosidase [Clostridiales bacterium]